MSVNDQKKYFTKVENIKVYERLSQELELLLMDESVSFTENQICLNTIPGKENDYKLGCGSLIYDFSKALWKDGNLISLPKYVNPYKEKDFSVLCSQFKDTLFEEVYNELKLKYNIGRLRIIKNIPRRCMSWHRDSSFRIHYPIKTQEGCMMVIEDEAMHIPQNEWWITDTRKWHTAFNGSKEERIHLVGAII